MESITDYGYSKMDNGTKVCHFLPEIKSTGLKAGLNLVEAQPEKHGTDFDATVLCLSQMVMKKGTSMQSICIAKTGNQRVKPKLAAFAGKIECKKYPKEVWNFMKIQQ